MSLSQPQFCPLTFQAGRNTTKGKHRTQWMREKKEPWSRSNMNVWTDSVDTRLVGHRLEKGRALLVTWHVSGPFFSLPCHLSSVLQLCPALANFTVFQRVSTEHSSAAVSKAAKYNTQKFTNSLSFGAAGDVDFLGRVIWPTVYGKVTLYHICFQSIPVHTSHQEAYITSHSHCVHLAFHRMAALEQTSWIRLPPLSATYWCISK